MSDRPPPQVIRPGPVRGARAAAAAAAASTAGVRRNLFQSQLMSRRHPTPPLNNSSSHNNHNNNNATGMATGTGSGSTSSTSGETLRLDLSSSSVDVLSDTASSSEIVVRDRNGEFEVGDPPTPPLLDDPGAEDGGMGGGAAMDDALENERERHRLAEAVKHYQINHNQAHRQPEEVIEILKASMRAQVAALAEDNWMFEAEEPSRP